MIELLDILRNRNATTDYVNLRTSLHDDSSDSILSEVLEEIEANVDNCFVDIDIREDINTVPDIVMDDPLQQSEHFGNGD
ncbi:unnamed protein product [Rotaria sp. Silwood2]|nr:unnamed protein product [Rotaria sp. Silwood2]CAF4051777.1 unnamed protein product [Rotaria sp. Silwood2]